MSYSDQIRHYINNLCVFTGVHGGDDLFSIKKDGKNLTITLDTAKTYSRHSDPQINNNALWMANKLANEIEGAKVEVIEQFVKFKKEKGRYYPKIIVVDPAEIVDDKAKNGYEICSSPKIKLTIPDTEKSLKIIVEANKEICKGIASKVLNDAIKCIKGNLNGLGGNISQIAYEEVLKEHGLAIDKTKAKSASK